MNIFIVFNLLLYGLLGFFLAYNDITITTWSYWGILLAAVGIEITGRFI